MVMENNIFIFVLYDVGRNQKPPGTIDFPFLNNNYVCSQQSKPSLNSSDPIFMVLYITFQYRWSIQQRRM